MKLAKTIGLLITASCLQACGGKTQSPQPTPPKTNTQTGAQLYTEQCSSCHGDNGNGATPIGSSRNLAALTEYIHNNMPKNHPEQCIDDCASKVAEYILSGFGVAASALATPSFNATANVLGTSYKAVGPMHVLGWQNEQMAVLQVDEEQWLYTSSKDTPLLSNCTSEACLSQWQPLLAPANASLGAPFAITERPDNHWQVTLNGMPLYLKAGGNNVPVNNDNWPLATPAPIQATNNWLVSSGRVWVLDANGAEWQNLNKRSLYIKTTDGTCKAACLNTWPALLAGAGAQAVAPYGLISRDDTDKKQWAYQGQPLYLYNADNEGDALGANLPNWQRASAIPVAWGQTSAGPALQVSGQALVYTQTENGWATQWQTINGRSLYTFANDGDFATDANAALACTGECATQWPPLMAHANSSAYGKFSLVMRGEGWQWAWAGKPLYLSAQDMAAGDTHGHKPQGLWLLAGWQAATASSSQPSPSPDDALTY